MTKPDKNNPEFKTDFENWFYNEFLKTFNKTRSLTTISQVKEVCEKNLDSRKS